MRPGSHTGPGIVIVEGLLMLGVGAERVRDRCESIVLLDDDYENAAKQESLWRRKWTRSGHLGKKSYRDRGVTEAQYERYWFDYVAPRWKAHGLDRLFAADRVRPSMLYCHAPLEENAKVLESHIREGGRHYYFNF